MIIANFRNDSSCAVTYSGLWQYDYGQTLRIQGLTLPTAVEIHFSMRETGGEAVTRVGVTRDGVTDVVIPDSMLENDGAVSDYRIYAFIYLTDDRSGETAYKIVMPVKSRPKPEAFDTPEDTELFREAIAAVNEAVANAASGLVPEIGDNGNWFVNGVDTGKTSVGEKGDTGAQGADGKDSKDGKSAYAYAQDGGYTGTEAEFMYKLAREYSAPDLAVNDPTDPAYIKNRTHYEADPVLTELMAEQTLEFTIDESGEFGANQSTEGISLVEGETYVVVFDGTEYQCVCQNINDVLCIGNLKVLEGYEDTGEPFMYQVVYSKVHDISIYAWGSYDTKTSHTVSVSNYQKPVVKIDSKFLPDSAFTDAVWENVSNKPFESTEINAVIQGVDTVNIFAGTSYSSVINTTVDFKFGYYYNIQGTITLIPNEKYEIRETLTVDGLFQASNKNMLKLGTITTSSSHATTIIELYGKNANYYPGFVGFNGDQLGSWDIEVDLTVLEEVLKLDEKYLPESVQSIPSAGLTEEGAILVSDGEEWEAGIPDYLKLKKYGSDTVYYIWISDTGEVMVTSDKPTISN